MISILRESEGSKIETNLLITADCRTYEDYDEDDDLSFELVILKSDLTDVLNEDVDNINSYLEEGQQISFKDSRITSAKFENSADYTSGKLAIKSTILSEMPISDDDLQYLSEMITDDIADNLEVQITGTATGVEVYGDYRLSDYRGEKEFTYEVDATTTISSILSNVDIQRL